MNNNAIKKEDYEGRCCSPEREGGTTPLPMERIIDKLDEYLGRNDYGSAERHLLYWHAEAEAAGDLRGKLTVLNEQIGLYRKVGKEPEGTKAIESALALARQLGLDGTVSMGTTLVNAATGYKAFGKPEEALPLYREARELYEAALEPGDRRLAGLYNNMAITLASLGEYREAEQLYYKSIDIMKAQENGEAETAVTYCNLADLVSLEKGLEAGERQIGEYLLEAERLLDTKSLPQDGNYAFICEKCAPTFGYYGYFLTERKLSDRAREIYERS